MTGDGSNSAYGVCFADLPDRGQTPCAVCDAGQGCVQRSQGSFECVPLEVCDDLRKLGAGDVCWYGDKVPYDGRAIPAASSCPDSDPLVHEDHSMCGGPCGPCDTAHGALDRCVGQGPDHPIGICAQFCCSGNPEDPASFPRCVVQGGTVIAACPTVGNYTCAVYPSPPGDESVAKQNGLCLNRDVCHALHASLPGGLDCYD